MGPGDVKIFLKRGNQEKEISPDKLRYMHRDIRRQLKEQMSKLAQFLKDELIWAYQKAIRVQSSDRGPGLMDKLRKAMDWTVQMSPEGIMMGVFDLAYMDRATRNEGFGTQNRGWFLLYEDGRVGRGHGTRDWTFVTLDEGMFYAEDCAQQFGLTGGDKQKFLADMASVFAGRHGQGIMVQNSEPLFFRFPTYGSPNGTPATAADVLHRSGHPGFYAWNVLGKVGGAMAPYGGYSRGKDNRMYQFVQNAIDRVLEEY